MYLQSKYILFIAGSQWFFVLRDGITQDQSNHSFPRREGWSEADDWSWMHGIWGICFCFQGQLTLPIQIKRSNQSLLCPCVFFRLNVHQYRMPHGLAVLFWLRPVPVFAGHIEHCHQELGTRCYRCSSRQITENRRKQASKSWNILKILLKILLNILLNTSSYSRSSTFSATPRCFLCHSPRRTAHPQRRRIPDSIPKGWTPFDEDRRAVRFSHQTPKDAEDSWTDDLGMGQN